MVARVQWIHTGTKNDYKELATHTASSVCLSVYCCPVIQMSHQKHSLQTPCVDTASLFSGWGRSLVKRLLITKGRTKYESTHGCQMGAIESHCSCPLLVLLSKPLSHS